MSTLFDNAMNYGFTENGALTHTSTGNAVLNLFSMGGALRNRPDSAIEAIVEEAYKENCKQTIQTLLYLRDVRGGQGEKHIFHVAINTLRKFGVDDNFNALLDAIVEVGSWKDVFTIFTVEEYAPYIKEICLDHIKTDKYSLLEKWMPSIGGSKNKDAEKLAKVLGLTSKQYRKYLSKARASLDVVEVKMCANNWSNINYEHVPSKAGLLHRNAFRNHDTERYNSFIQTALKNDGSVKLNTSTLAPYEITGKYFSGCNWYSLRINKNDELEAFWKNLPDYTDGSNSLVVADTSGSMYGMPMNIATSLAIYFAERNTGIFHNEYVTFAGKPQFIKFKDTDSLADKLQTMYDKSICDNTNIQAVFELILTAAKRNNIPESEMPKNIYIISDMEFDSCTEFRRYDDKLVSKMTTNFDAIKSYYEANGYKMPNLIFWNVNSRQNNVPVTKNEAGVALVSGSSASTFKMVIGDDLNPMTFMLNIINNEKYVELTNKIFN